MSTLPPSSSLPPPPPRLIDDRRWGVGDAFATLGVFFFVSTVVAIVGLAVSGGGVLDGPWLPLVVALPPAVQLGHVLWVGREKGRGAVEDFVLRFRPSDLAVGAGLCVMGLIAAGFVGSIVFALLDEEPSASVADLVEDSAGGGGLTVWIVLLAVFAATLVPLVEELVFRGLWWSALSKRGLSNVWCLVVTSGVFALFHIEPTRTPVLFVLGLAIGYGRIRTGRIGPCIAGHALINTIAMTFLLIDLA